MGVPFAPQYPRSADRLRLVPPSPASARQPMGHAGRSTVRCRRRETAGDTRVARSRVEQNVTQYVPSPAEWVRNQVELYERTDGAEGWELRGLPVVVVTHRGRKTGAVRKTPLMRVADGDGYVLVGSLGGAPQNPVWVYNLLDDPNIEVRDRAVVQAMRARLVEDPDERTRLWSLAVEAYPDYADYQERTERVIPLFRAEPV